MEKYLITLRGCDDSTYMLMDLTEEERVVLEKIEVLSIRTSSSNCMPVLYIDKFDEEKHKYELSQIEYQEEKRLEKQEADRKYEEQQELRKKYNNFKF